MRAALLSCGLACLAAGEISAAELPPPVEMTAEQDHRLMMDKLGIGALRQGANGRDPNAPNAANYDESKANPYPALPDPLKLANGKPVRTAKDWWKKRRPELVELFDREIYGRTPQHTPGGEVGGQVDRQREASPTGTSWCASSSATSTTPAYPAISVDIDSR